ncbi:hypothetical protein FQR65_LT08680 [Abscondita terminalis]|nr:hypothetical protein FQR65_LT08680 [Abscondita terminalis]
MEVNSVDTNISCKKRKLSSKGELGEVSDDESCTESGDTETMEPDIKISSIESLVPSQCSDSGIESLSYNSQSSLELLNHDAPPKYPDKSLLELEDQNQRLREENEMLKLKSCPCEQIENKAIITIKFNSLDNFRLHKSKFLKLFDSYVNIDVEEHESHLLLKIHEDDTIDSKEWVVVDETDCVSSHNNKHKKKKKKRTVSDSVSSDVFILDTTPSISTKNNLQYERKFDFVSDIDKKDEISINTKVNSIMCFNCEEDHILKDCPKPRDFNKINASRQKMKSYGKGMVYKRYHLEDDQKFGHMQPGKISKKLQEALGLQLNQLPEYIYRMRHLGYPPGWYEEIIAAPNPSLDVFDFDGKTGNKSTKGGSVDLDKVVDYHGFNVPLQKGYRDEYRMYRSSPYSKDMNKQKMLEYLQNIRQETQDNLESCDMDIDNNPEDKEFEVIDVAGSLNETKVAVENVSPTLVELETEKEMLLAQLTEDVNESKEISNNSGIFVTLDSTGTIEEISNIETSNAEELLNSSLDMDKTLDSSKMNVIKASSFGTPILKSASPYSHLPKFDNFTKNVSGVIHFENLPNSTGKYDQMVGVIAKVRTTLKTMQDKQL